MERDGRDGRDGTGGWGGRDGTGGRDGRRATLAIVRGALLDALAVVLPVECGGCGADDRGLCRACRAALEPRPVLRRASGVTVWSGLRYDGVARRVILAAKDLGRTDLCRALAPALAAAVGAAVTAATATGVGSGALLLVPVPSSRAGRRRRGYDPLRLVARAAGLRLHPALARGRARAAPQKSLGVSGRALNAVGSVRARGDLRGRRILLLDDVVTTGATLAEALRVLEEAGAEVVGAAVIASTPRRRADSQPR